jgi:hypothetical protein
MRRAAACGIGLCAAAALWLGTLLLGTGAGSGAREAAPEQARWTEAAWPFPMDQWGLGQAYRCAATDCGVEVVVYLRAKVGFCSATRGVADDDELERLADFDFMEGRPRALAAGHEIAVAGMAGRARAYAVSGFMRPHSRAVSIAVNSNDDALVATAMFDAASPQAVEPAVLAFLRGPVVQRWVAATLGL